MTPAERVAYAHGRIASDMRDFQRQIDHAHETILRERTLWLVLVAVSTVMLMIVFYFAGPNQLIDYILIGAVLVAFTTIRFISYKMIAHQISTLELMQTLYSRLADDETIGFSTETMKVEANGEAAKKIYLAGLGATDRQLHDEMISAMRILSALLIEIEKQRGNESTDAPGSVIEEANSG